MFWGCCCFFLSLNLLSEHAKEARSDEDLLESGLEKHVNYSLWIKFGYFPPFIFSYLVLRPIAPVLMLVMLQVKESTFTCIEIREVLGMHKMILFGSTNISAKKKEKKRKKCTSYHLRSTSQLMKDFCLKHPVSLDSLCTIRS